MPKFHTISTVIAVLAIALASAPAALAQAQAASRGGPNGGGNGGPSLGDPPYSCLTLMQNCNPQAIQPEGCERERVREWIDARHYRWVYRCAERIGR